MQNVGSEQASNINHNPSIAKLFRMSSVVFALLLVAEYRGVVSCSVNDAKDL
jgi:hypothetical protein